MYDTFAYYTSALRGDFALYCKEELQKKGFSPGLLYFLIYIGKTPGCSQRELAAAVRADEGYTARSVNKLQTDGFIERKRHKQDKRTTILTLTTEGEEIYKKAHTLFHEWDEKTLAALNTEEKALLFALLKKIRPDTPQYSIRSTSE